MNEIQNLIEDHIIDSLIEKERKVFQGPTSSDFQFRIPLSPTFGKTRVPALCFKPISKEANKIFIGLLWQSLFGHYFRVSHWYILFKILEKQKYPNDFTFALYVILKKVTPKGGPYNFNSNLRSIKTVSKEIRDLTGSEPNLLGDILKLIPISLPRKEPNLSELISISLGFIEQRKPEPVVRIGVGYKDKGSIGKNSGVEPEQQFELPLLREDMFVILQKRFESQFTVRNFCVIPGIKTYYSHL